MSVLWLMFLLQIKHCIADFFLQTGKSVGAKNEYFNRSNIMHSANHGWLTGVVILIVTGNVIAAITLAIVDWVVHYHLDWAKASLVVIKQWTPDKSIYWWAFGVDQLLHQLTYLAITAFVMHNYGV